MDTGHAGVRTVTSDFLQPPKVEEHPGCHSKEGLFRSDLPPAGPLALMPRAMSHRGTSTARKTQSSISGVLVALARTPRHGACSAPTIAVSGSLVGRRGRVPSLPNHDLGSKKGCNIKITHRPCKWPGRWVNTAGPRRST
jgi:hypothetical protein